ncbi:MAG: 50S ribosomal protein L29 [Candidatus Methylomirabilaceae bacterium]
MKASALREMTPAEIQKKLGEAEREIFALRIKVSQAPNTARIRDVRRDIARMKAALGARGIRV